MPRRTAYLILLFLCAAVAGGSFLLRHFLETLPPTHELEEYLPRLTTRVFDVHGEVVSELFTERRTWLPLNQIPVDLQNAFIAVEDDRFFKHWGISPQGMMRAAVKNFLAGRVVQGGSTITQQLSKLIFLTQEKTIGRKMRELLLALQIESKFSKEEILQMYLNQVYFGQGAYGVSAAARIYFGKTVQELTLAECALLAGLPRLPNYYSPFVNPERALTRRNVVLSRMRQMKYISKEEEDLCRKTGLTTQKTPMPGGTAPYFTDHLRQNLEAKYGSDMLYRGGLSIHTTLDLKMQMAAERIMAEALDAFDKEYGPGAEILRAKEKTAALRKAGSVSKRFTVKPSTTVTPVQAALVALDPRTGGVRAMVGGRDFAKSQFNRATQAKRQPGSAFKPFVWISALESGLTAGTVIDDFPTLFINDGHDWRLVEEATDTYAIALATVGVAEDKVWTPKNYDGKYFGPTTLRRGLAFSRNIVSIRLIDKLTPQKVVEWAQKMGIQSPMEPVLSLALGTSVMSLMELTSALGTIAAEGIRTEPYIVTRVVDFEGKVLEENFPREVEVVPPQLNYLITHLMRAVVTQGTGRSAAAVKRPLAGKTGTTQDQRDLWFVGFTPNLVCGAWMGYDDFAPLGKKLAAGAVLVPWWASFMKEALADLPEKDFMVPEGVNFTKIDSLTGLLANPTCPKVILEAFKTGTEPREYCPIDHEEDKLPEMETEE